MRFGLLERNYARMDSDQRRRQFEGLVAELESVAKNSVGADAYETSIVKEKIFEFANAIVELELLLEDKENKSDDELRDLLPLLRDRLIPDILNPIREAIQGSPMSKFSLQTLEAMHRDLTSQLASFVSNKLQLPPGATWPEPAPCSIVQRGLAR